MTDHQPAISGRPATGYVGAALPRREDGRLLRGHGRYVDDLEIPGVLEIAFLRSTQPHARIVGIDTSRARALPGVIAVYTGADVVGRVKPLVNAEELRIPPGIQALLDPVVRIHPMPPLATTEVTYVGQPVAMVVADSRYLAEDGLELIDVSYDPLPAVIDPVEALAADAPRVLMDFEDNIGVHVRHGVGDVDDAFAKAAVVIDETFASQRYVPSPIEPRGLAARVDPYDGHLLIWSNTQTPHRMRDHVANSLDRSVDSVRVIAVDVGGGFGQKGILVVEELLVPFAATDLGRPVRWMEDRNENLVAGTHAREQAHRIQLAADSEGRLLAVRDRAVTNLGTRNMVGLVVPYNALCHLIGPYRVPNVDIEAIGVITNTMFTSPYRGAGRPEAAFAMERAIDRLASKLGLDPADVRERNLVRPEDMPYRTGMLDRRGLPQEFDSGDYPAMLAKARDAIDLPALRERQRALRAEGRYLGVGFAMYLEMTGLGPFEGAAISVRNSGRVQVATGAPSQGQGHATTFAQIAADALGVPIESIDVVGGDTSTIPYGVGTIASRALVTAGNAIHQAGRLLRERILDNAANVLKVERTDLELVDGVIRQKNASTRMTLAELLLALPKAPGGTGSDGLSETSYFQPPNYATSSGLHAVVVEVDPATGRVDLQDYVVVHEAGRIVNPLVAHGQVIGGTVQGIGGALLEHLQYDPTGQPTTSTFMDYLLPTVESVPEIRLFEMECPSPTNALGVKGLGEGGAIGPPAAIANAVEDALSPYEIVIRSCPLTPNRIRSLLRDRHNPLEEVSR
jgi:carbon-monoxide dehydrogenase large subunit